MSKLVKDLVTKEISSRLEGLEGVAVINPRGIDGAKNHAIRKKLRDAGLRMTVVKNTLARRAVEGSAKSKLKGFDKTKLVENINAMIAQVRKMKPQTSKGHYFKKLVIKSSMSPAVYVAIS